MNLTTTQATTLTGQDWTALTIYKTDTVNNGAVVPTYNINLGYTTLEFIGDSTGKPIKLLPNLGPMGMGVSIPVANLPAGFLDTLESLCQGAIPASTTPAGATGTTGA